MCIYIYTYFAGVHICNTDSCGCASLPPPLLLLLRLLSLLPFEHLAHLAGDVVTMTTAFVASAKPALKLGAVPHVKFRCSIVEKHRHRQSALPARHLPIAAALVVRVACGKMLWRIQAAAPGPGKLKLNSKASVSDAFLHGPMCTAHVLTLLAASTPERHARRS